MQLRLFLYLNDFSSGISQSTVTGQVLANDLAQMDSPNGE